LHEVVIAGKETLLILILFKDWAKGVFFKSGHSVETFDKNAYMLDKIELV
jgi:hypothetical protein